MSANNPTILVRENPVSHKEKDDTGDLPEVNVSKNGTCVCPFCLGLFRITSEDTAPREKTESEGELSCMRCGYTWSRRKTRPRKCPGCGTYKWDSKANRFICVHCSHEWTSSLPDGPARCPRCRRANWMEGMKTIKNPSANEPNEDTLRRWICERYDNGIGCIQIAKELKLPVMKVSNLIKRYYGLKGNPIY